MAPTPTEVFHRLVSGVAERRWEELALLYAEETDVTHPFHPDRPPAMRTREELRAHFTRDRGEPDLRFAPTNVTVHETTDPEVIVAEFEYAGTVVDTGAAFTVPGVFVMRIRDGEIVESRDYFDHLPVDRALGRA
jgi:ketosteroid isomerase-like protein